MGRAGRAIKEGDAAAVRGTALQAYREATDEAIARIVNELTSDLRSKALTEEQIALVIEELATAIFRADVVASMMEARRVAREVGNSIDNIDELKAWLDKGSDIAASALVSALVDKAREAVVASAALDVAVAALMAIRDRFIDDRATRVIGRAALMAARKSGARFKVWTTRKSRTGEREEHLAMAGERVPLGGRFSNGADGPGDYPALGASGVSGCNCYLRFTL